MKTIFNGKTIAKGIIILLVLILAVICFKYFNDPSNVHPTIKTVFSKVPFLSKATSKHLNEGKKQDILEEEKIRIEHEWAEIESQKQQLADKQAQLIKKESELEALEKQLNADKEKLESTLTNIKDLARYYELMEPRNAASILENMDDDLLIQLLRHLKREVVSEILANLDSKRAAAITKKMSGL
ncbi:MAG: magnesium transporter MgtE [Thermoanaerobacteraceae bacterium]|nr:magnesium transporter MgtE [Thermoanaerobacteraceae bacterium]